MINAKPCSNDTACGSSNRSSRTRITKLNKQGGKVTSSRLSPKRGSVLDLFEELIYFTRVFPNPNLVLEVPIVHVEEIRLPCKNKRRRRWHKDYQLDDVKLESIDRTFEFAAAVDLLEILGWRSRPNEFNTAEMAQAIDRPRWVAQQIAYVLRKMGAIESIGRTKSGVIYEEKGDGGLFGPIERNALPARLVTKAEVWQYGLLWRWLQRPALKLQLMSPWPIRRSPDWVARVNEPWTEMEREAVRLSVQRDRPLVDEDWTQSIADRPGLWSTIRPRGRPSKKR